MVNLCSGIKNAYNQVVWKFKGIGLIGIMKYTFSVENNISHAISLVVNIFIAIEACNLQVSLMSAVSEPMIQVTLES